LQQDAAVKGNVAVLLKAEMGSTKSADHDCLNGGDIASLHVTVDDVQFERLTDSGSEMISVLDAPVALDVVALHEIGTILAATDLPAGDYAGGLLLLSNAEASLTSAPGDFLPVALPDSGVLAFDADFSIGGDDDGVLKLKLKRVRICMMPDDSLYLKTSCGFEAEVERHGSSGGDDDVNDGYITAEMVEAFGRIDDLGDNEFKLKIKDRKVLVDFSQAEILLPPATDGGDPVVGGPADLEESAEVLVYGALVLQDHFVIFADTVQVVAWSQNDDDDHDGDHDGDDDDGDDDHDGDDDDDGDDDRDGHHGGGGTFDEYGNTTGFGIPSGFAGNAFTGEDLYATSCAACHPSPYGNVEGERYGETKEALHEVSEMSFLDLSRQQIADITAYLNWDGTGAPPPPPPPAAPSAPAIVQASDGAYADKVAVTWNASAGATGYEVWRNTSNSSAGATLIGDPVGTSYDDLTAVQGTTYFYWAKAANSSGTSGFSAGDSGFAATPPPPSGPFDENGNTTAYNIPSPLVGNIAAGTTVWSNKCSGCHPSPFGAVGAFTYPALASKLASVPLMSGIVVSDQEKADLTAYLNRADATP